jgi:glutamate transport system permease protein
MEDRPMSQSVLFDAPGPKTIRRHRLYTVLTLAVIAGAVAFTAYKLNQEEQFTADKWEVFTTPDYVRVILVDGLVETLKMAAGGIAGALVLGVVLGIGKLSDHRFVRVPCWAVVELFRAIPVLLLMIFFFSLYGISHGTTGSFWCVVWALSLYNGAVLAEVFRAGILAVPAGQGEAAYAVGLRKGQVMSIVLLPQAVKIMIPAIISQCVVTLKDTSLGYAIAAPGLTAVARPIYLEFQNHIPVYLVIAALYIAVNLVLTALATWVQKRFVGEKKVLQVAMVGEQTAEAKPL